MTSTSFPLRPTSVPALAMTMLFNAWIDTTMARWFNAFKSLMSCLQAPISGILISVGRLLSSWYCFAISAQLCKHSRALMNVSLYCPAFWTEPAGRAMTAEISAGSSSIAGMHLSALLKAPVSVA